MADKNMFLKTYSFFGKHAEMVDALISKFDSTGTSVFTNSIDLFIMSSLVGVINEHKAKPDSNREKERKIMAEQFVSHSAQVKLAFKFVTLLGNEDKYDDITRLNKAFRNPETDQNYKSFEEYVIGGLEDIYDVFMVDSNRKYEDFLYSLNNFIGEYSEKPDYDIVIPDASDLFDF